MIRLSHLDHLVLTVTDIAVSCAFYQQVLGMQHQVFGQGRHALVFGQHKINLHPHGKEFEPKAAYPTPGSADLCLIAETEITEIMAHLQHCGVSIEEGPVPRTGATVPIISVYFRDPDHNLIELSNPA